MSFTGELTPCRSLSVVKTNSAAGFLQGRGNDNISVMISDLPFSDPNGISKITFQQGRVKVKPKQTTWPLRGVYLMQIPPSGMQGFAIAGQHKPLAGTPNPQANTTAVKQAAECKNVFLCSCRNASPSPRPRDCPAQGQSTGSVSHLRTSPCKRWCSLANFHKKD